MLGVVLVRGMKEEVLIFQFSVLNSLHPAGLLHLSSSGCRTDLPKCCSEQQECLCPVCWPGFPSNCAAVWKAEPSSVELLCVQRNTDHCRTLGEVWAWEAWQKLSLFPFHWSGVPWGNQRCDGKSKLSSLLPACQCCDCQKSNEKWMPVVIKECAYFTE